MLVSWEHINGVHIKVLYQNLKSYNYRLLKEHIGTEYSDQITLITLSHYETLGKTFYGSRCDILQY